MFFYLYATDLQEQSIPNNSPNNLVEQNITPSLTKLQIAKYQLMIFGYQSALFFLNMIVSDSNSKKEDNR